MDTIFDDVQAKVAFTLLEASTTPPPLLLTIHPSVISYKMKQKINEELTAIHHHANRTQPLYHCTTALCKCTTHTTPPRKCTTHTTVPQKNHTTLTHTPHHTRKCTTHTPHHTRKCTTHTPHHTRRCTTHTPHHTRRCTTHTPHHTRRCTTHTHHCITTQVYDTHTPLYHHTGVRHDAGRPQMLPHLQAEPVLHQAPQRHRPFKQQQQQ